MVKTADKLEFNAEERAIVEAFGGEENVQVAELVARASSTQPASRVREAYWELVSAGLLVTNAAGLVRLKH